MPINTNNFTSNSLSGTTTVTNGAANITLGTIPFALEGSKSFVIDLRRNSIAGDIIATSPVITLQDTSSFISLTANVASVGEGSLVSFTLVTANAANNANLYYSVFPVTANLTVSDFYNSNVGVATLVNNQATFSLYANTDAGFVNEDGENFKVQLRTNSVTGNIVYSTANIEILDYYKLATITGITSNVVVLQGANVIFSVSTINANGISLSYSTEGNVNSTNFIGGNTGSFVANATGGFIVLQSNTNIPLNEVRQFRLRVNQSGQPATVSSNVTLFGPISYIEATGGTVITTGGYRTHVFTSSANLDVSSLGASTTVEYLIVAGGGGGGAGRTPNPAPIAGGGAYGGGGGGGAGGTFIGNATVGLGGTVIVVGGGAGAAIAGRAGYNGSNTTIALFGGSTILAYGGGGGSGIPVGEPAGGPAPGAASPGGSGGGTAPDAVAGAGGGTPGQGYPGAGGIDCGITDNLGGGGGGAAESGVSTNGPNNSPGTATRGGDGIGVPWVPGSYGTPGPTPGARYFGGGGAGGNSPAATAYDVRGGYGGGGAGGAYYSPPSGAYAIGRNTGGRDGGGNADGNTGGGGGGVGAGGQSSGSGQGGPGGSGIVIIRYPYI